MTPTIFDSSDKLKKRLIQVHLRCFVPLSIAEIWLRGGLGLNDLKRAEELSGSLAEHGDAILFFEGSRKAKKEGFDTESMLKKLVESVAILAFCPGGVTIFDCSFDAEQVHRGWAMESQSPPNSETAEAGEASEVDAFNVRVDLARVLPVMRALAALEVRWFGHNLDRLEALLPLAVLNRVLKLWKDGGPTNEMVASIVASLPDLEQRGDDLFALKEGESRRRFIQVTCALAVLSFLPVGVTCFGMSFNARDMAALGLAAFHQEKRKTSSGETTCCSSTIKL